MLETFLGNGLTTDSMIGSAIAIVLFYLIPIFRKHKKKTNWHLLLIIAKIAVAAIEQLHKGKPSETKFESAKEEIKAQIKKVGITFDDETIKSVIEASVLDLPNRDENKTNETKIDEQTITIFPKPYIPRNNQKGELNNGTTS